MTRYVLPGLVLAGLLSWGAPEAPAQPANPCAAKAANPCAAKAANPCAAKQPAAAQQPCAAKLPVRRAEPLARTGIPNAFDGYVSSGR